MIRAIFGDDRTPVDINSFSTLFAAVYMGMIGPEVFIVQPGFVQGLVQYLGYSEQMAGDISSAEMWGIAVTTVIMTFFAGRFNWRHVFAGSLIIMAIGNIASLFADTALYFGFWRFVAGFGAGGVVSLSFTVVGLTGNPDRNFGFYIMWVLIYGAVVLFAMPLAYKTVGVEGVIIFFALFPISGLFLVRNLPTSGREHDRSDAGAVSLPVQYQLLALGAMFFYFLAQGVVWAYLFLIGTTGGGTEQEIANGLTASQFFGVAGALTAAMLGSRRGRIGPLSIGIIGGIAPLAFLFHQMGPLVYGVAVCVYNYAWNLTHPFLVAAMASFDRSGRVVIYAVACQMMGLANGPWIAARVIDDGDFSSVNWLGMALFALALVLIIAPIRKHHQLRYAGI